MKLDMTDVRIMGEPVPAATYRVTITDFDDTKTTSPDSPKYPNQPMISYEMTIQSGEQQGRKVFQTCVLHKDLLGNLKALMLYSGKWTEEDLNSEIEDFEPGDLMGCEYKVKVGFGKGQFADSNQIKRVMPVTEADAAEEGDLP